MIERTRGVRKVWALEARPACDAIVVAAGRSQRFHDTLRKQFLSLGAETVLARSIRVFAAHPLIREVIVVTSREEREQAVAATPPDLREAVRWADGGDTRSASVFAGLSVIAARPPVNVLIHDAARPGVQGADIDALLDALQDSDAAAPALPVADALKRRLAEGRIETALREDLYSVQTPQGFAYHTIFNAYRSFSGAAVDDLALIEQLPGVRVAFTPGRTRLMKLTYPEDWVTLQRLLGDGSPRIGSGYDVHAFAQGDHVRLCGIDIPHSHSLAGHSDADAAWHALTDAILGAIGAGDIGDHFPPSDPRWRGADSRLFLEFAVKRARDGGYCIGNADVTIICERPKIAPHRDRMRFATAEVLGVPADRVNVKATTTEQLGFTGRREGLAAEAVVMLLPVSQTAGG